MEYTKGFTIQGGGGPPLPLLSNRSCKIILWSWHVIEVLWGRTYGCIRIYVLGEVDKWENWGSKYKFKVVLGLF